MSAITESTVANDAGTLLIDEGDANTDRALLDSAPTIAPTPQAFERIRTLFNYRGEPRTKCSDEEWGLVLAAVKDLVSRIPAGDGYNEIPGWIHEGLEGLKGSRPVEQLIVEIDAATDGAGHYWLARCNTRAKDFGVLLQTAYSLGWEAMSNPRAEPRDTSHVLINDFMNQSEPSWLVDSVLMTGSILAAVFGEPGSGKSTIVLEMLLAIAQGIKWHGHEVQQAAVAYLAAESVVGLRKRLKAYEQVHNIQLNSLSETFFPIPSGLNLSDPQDVEKLIKYLKTLPTPHQLRVVAIDTLAQVTPGVNENTSDMGVPLGACKRIHAETGAIVLLITHSGKDQTRGIRGWSGILGALDTEIEVSWNRDSEVRSVAVRKQRDGECNHPLFDCQLEQVVYGHDSKNRKLSSVVVKEVPPHDLPISAARRAIRDVFAVGGRPMTFHDLVNAAKVGLDPPNFGKKDRRAERIKQTYRRMLADNTLIVQGGLISLAVPFGLMAEQPANGANDDLVNGDAVASSAREAGSSRGQTV